MLQTDFENNLYNIISAVVVPTQVIFANQKGPRPDLPYITINVTPNQKIGSTAYYPRTDDQGEQKPKYDIDYTVAFNAYGRLSIAELEKIRDNIISQTGRDTYFSAGISVREENTIQDISILVDSTIEKRWVYEVTYGVGHEIVDNPSYVGTANITGTYN